MKKLIITVALGCMIPLMNYGQSGNTGLALNTGTSLTVSGQPHNFATQTGWNPYVNAGLGQQVCQPCHTPHNAQTTTDAPLWNHQFSNAAYTFYNSINTAAGTMGLTNGPPVVGIDGTSKLCLSCHDGTVALGAFGGQSPAVGSAQANTIVANASLGTDLSNDHPISIDYMNAVRQGVSTSTATSGGWGGLNALTTPYAKWDPVANTYAVAVATDLPSKLLDSNGKVQCTSCHGAHSNSRGYQLKMDNRGSALCLACHKK